MKRLQSYLLAFLFAAGLSSCDKDGVQELKSSAIGAQIKFYNFGLNAPSVNFYANTTKVTAIGAVAGVESTSGTAYSVVAPLNNYATLPGGQYAFKAQISATTDKDLAVSTVNSTIDNGKFYSFYMCGFYNTSAKTIDAFVIEDKVPAVDSTAAYVRFVNAISNAPQAMNLVAKVTTGTLAETTVGTGIAYKAGSEFVKVSEGIYDLTIRYPLTPAVAVFNRTAVTFLKGRVYTISSRGDMTVSATGTATTRPFLDNTLNR